MERWLEDWASWPERLELVRTDRNFLPRRLPLTRSTVKIRTPSLLKKSRPAPQCWGKLDYMGAA